MIRHQSIKHSGIYLFATGGTVIPPHMAVNADTTCKYNEELEITPFAYRYVILKYVVILAKFALQFFTVHFTSYFRTVDSLSHTLSLKGNLGINKFLFVRTHTHGLGVRVSAWREREGTWTLLGSGDPRKPQMFYLMKGDPHPVRKGIYTFI